MRLPFRSHNSLLYTELIHSLIQRRSLFQDPLFALLFVSTSLATFTLFVPPFFLPLYATSIGLNKRTGAILVASYNFCSALGRLGLGYASDIFGPLNTLLFTLSLSAISVLAIWPVSTSLAPLGVFVVLNGMAGGGFFSLAPTVVGSVFGAHRVPIVLGMMVTGWAAGYLMVSPFNYNRVSLIIYLTTIVPIRVPQSPAIC
jgi:MFS family permease